MMDRDEIMENRARALAHEAGFKWENTETAAREAFRFMASKMEPAGIPDVLSGQSSYLISGDPFRPTPGDLIAQTAYLSFGEPVPAGGWRVIDGGTRSSKVARVVARHETEVCTW